MRRAPARLLWIPVAIALVLGFARGPFVRLADDWIFFSHFAELPLLPGQDGAESAVLTNATEADGLRFRPFAYAHMWVEARLGLGFTVSCLIGNLYIGLAGSALLMLLVALGLSDLRASIAALLFVAHPAHAEVYGWATARIDTMAACLGIAALCSAVRRRPILAAAALTAACLSKESAYPLVVVMALLPAVLGRGSSWRCVLPAVAAFVAVVASKVACVGRFTASSWSQAMSEYPLADRALGYLSYLDPLLLRPVGSAAGTGAADWLAPAFTACLVVALLVPCVALVDPRARKRARASTGTRARLAFWLGAGLLLTLAATFGVPVRDDFTGGRLWFLPSAFLAGLLVVWSRLWLTASAAVSGTVLLVINLAPYREAGVRMDRVLAEVEAELADETRAVRATGLPAWHGPVPLFALTTVYYFNRTDGRALLSTGEQHRRDPDGVATFERRWREAIGERGLSIVEMRWDGAGARLIRD